MAVTVANGGDNVSVYTPLFRQAGPGDTLVYVAVFARPGGGVVPDPHFLADRARWSTHEG